MMKLKDVSLVMPSRNNKKYFKWAYDSIRKNIGSEIKICAADDASNDGTLELFKKLKKNDTNFSYIVNTTGKRKGHTILYDQIINELVKTPLAIINHADMYWFSNSISNLLKHIKEKTIVSATRIEPLLHPSGKEKLQFDMGIEPETFKEKEMKEFVKESEIKYKNQITEGIFAPWLFWVKEFQNIGGHDPLYAPQSKEDSIYENRILLLIENDEIKLMRIEELFNKYQHLSEMREDGHLYIDFQKHNIKIVSATANNNQSVGRNYIKKIIKKKNTKELVKVRTNWGETICTIDHSLLDKNLNSVKPYDIKDNNIWEPLKLTEWTRRTIINKIDFNKIDLNIKKHPKKRKSNPILYKFPIIQSIDEYGNNQQLINICEFLGFFAAEGSTHINYEKTRYAFSFDQTDLNLLNYFKEKSLSLIPELKYGNYISSKRDNHQTIFKYTKGSKIIAHFLKALVGSNSENKQIPDFIFNIPKAYQKAFLYGYLCGDGYLGSEICRQKKATSFSVNKQLLFNKNIFSLLNWKSTSKSDKLTAGINYLLRKNFPEIKTTIYFSDKRNVYNISTVKSYKKNILELTNLGIVDCNVYDLEVKGTHTFIDAMGLFGVHNSDIFNRFILDGYKTIQARDSFVAHLTCRGSRYNPQLTTIGKESDEWLIHNRKSSRNFIRKWGSFVKHDEYLKPIVPHKFNVSFVIENGNLQLLEALEPWCDKIYINLTDQIIESYIRMEQPNTLYNLKNKINNINHQYIGDVIITFDGSQFNQDRFNFITQLADILNQVTEVGTFEYDIFKIKVNQIKHYEKNLIFCDKTKK